MRKIKQNIVIAAAEGSDDVQHQPDAGSGYATARQRRPGSVLAQILINCSDFGAHFCGWRLMRDEIINAVA
jgi:hypothetical protein